MLIGLELVTLTSQYILLARKAMYATYLLNHYKSKTRGFLKKKEACIDIIYLTESNTIKYIKGGK